MLLAYDVDVAFHGVLAQEKILHPLTPTCPSHPEFQCCFFFMGASGAKGGKKNSSLASPANCSRRAAFQATLKSRVQGSAAKRGAIFFPVTVYSFCGLVKEFFSKRSATAQHTASGAHNRARGGDMGEMVGGREHFICRDRQSGRKRERERGYRHRHLFSDAWASSGRRSCERLPFTHNYY